MRSIDDELIAADESGLNVVPIRAASPIVSPRRVPSAEEMQAISDGGYVTSISNAARLLEITAWQDQPVPEREWLVRDRIPMKTVTGLSGDGGVGKSLIAAQLAAAMALGRDWLGTMPTSGPSIYFSAEDDEDELQRRFARIAEHYGASFRDLEGLHIVSLAGADAVLAHTDKSNLLQPTRLFSWLRQSVGNVCPKMVAIDTAADVFAGMENDRAQVRQFVNLLRGIAIDYSTSVLLLSHPSIAGMASGTGTSGSTAWNNSVRSRLYLKRATTKGGDEPDPDLRELEVMKANYGPVGERVRVRWSNGVLVPEGGPSSLERLALSQRADETFLRLLEHLIEQGHDLGPNPTGSNYAPTAIANHPEAGGIRKSEFVAAMQRLLDGGQIHINVVGSPSRKRRYLAMGAQS